MYEIKEWEGKELQAFDEVKDIKVLVEPVFLGAGSNENLMDSISILPENDDSEGIDITEIQFASKLKKAEKDDYTFAVISGMLSVFVDYIIGARIDFQDLTLDDLDETKIQEIIKKVMTIRCFSEDVLHDFDKELLKKARKAEEAVQHADQYAEMAEDFGAGLNYGALIISVFSELTGKRYGLDKDDKIVQKEIPEDERVEGFKKCVIAGFVKWLVSEALEYQKTKQFKEEMKDVIHLAKGMTKTKEIIKALANSKLFKDKKVDKKSLNKWIAKEVKRFPSELDKAEKHILVKQAIPVELNKSLVRSWYFVKNLLAELKERDVKSLEGLAFISVDDLMKDTGRAIARMDTVSSGVFAAADVSNAVLRGIKAGLKDYKESFNTKRAVGKGITAVACNINVVNILQVVTVIRTDAAYIVDDLKNRKTKEAVEVVIPEVVDYEQIDYLRTFDKNETKILYSLERLMIEDDIHKTKKSDMQIRKAKWRDEWMNTSVDSLKMKKLFEADEEKTYKMLKTRAAAGTEQSWLYRAVLEMAAFQPYSALSGDSEKNKQYKGLHTEKGDYLKDVFCKKQEIVTADDVDKLLKKNKKYYDDLSGKSTKTAVGVAGAVAVSAIGAAAAFTFAPAIAVGLAGHAFASLHGAALVNASLALFGGGSIAAGGLGMAGGAIVIAGGGALVGLGASGITASAFILLATPEFVQKDYAKLLANCDYVLLEKYGMINEVCMIQKKVAADLTELKTRFAIAKDRSEAVLAANENKDEKKEHEEVLKDLETSIKTIEKANSILVKMIKKHSN